MYQLARIKFAEEDHDQSNVVCEEIKAELKVTAKTIVTNWIRRYQISKKSLQR